MGALDSVWARCPNCNSDLEFQSKAGDCKSINFRSSSVPENLAIDLDQSMCTCPDCGTHVVLKYEGRSRRVRMQVEILDTEGADFESDDNL